MRPVGSTITLSCVGVKPALAPSDSHAPVPEVVAVNASASPLLLVIDIVLGLGAGEPAFQLKYNVSGETTGFCAAACGAKRASTRAANNRAGQVARLRTDSVGMA